MQRDFQLNQIRQDPGRQWDIIVIGGGATGLGIALDASSRGYETLLLEQSDFAKGTSSRSTKLVHGGVRYLAQGDVSLVLEALHERGLLRRNAPHLVKNQAFIIPNYDWWEGPFYNIGMKVYDMMAGRLGLGPSEKISREAVLKAIPNLDEAHLNGGVIYYDGQFDDSRLAVNLAQTAIENGAVVLNYMPVTGLVKDKNNMVCGVETVDAESRECHTLLSKVVINATGVFVDNVLSMDDPNTPVLVRPSQGIHFVLDKSFLQGDAAIMIPKTSDGRVLFAVPWHGKVVVGTTDTPLGPDKISLEPRPLDEEINFILKTAAQYLKKDPKKEDVLSVFAGLRPLAAQLDGQSHETKEISRSHRLTVSLSGLITITGGKWTTYRKMAEDTVNKAWMVGGFPEKKCVTQTMPIHGYVKNINFDLPDYFYGADRVSINDLIQEDPDLGKRLHPDYEYTRAQVVWAVHHEMARTLEDVLSRRIRMLLLDARASVAMAPEVARIMARELKRDEGWIRSQLTQYRSLADGYILK
ncbi:glycerol-3-phosphate dehydrogenase/oxidase [Desulfospira joergensenii]|uniref:glycerol-3-phosphate dehydrogenase/oxidase n=1 Tax=Desulfospira joergensenii TaxID=53329 RepID=UPI0003B7133D|nr:glycerol-3-phosphate dehydrogenase/oxidase [Desulfospira joergensenii]